MFLARLKLARGDVAGAAAILAQADQFVRQHNFVHRMPEVAASQVLILLRQGNLAAAAHLAETHEPSHQPGPGTPGSGRPASAAWQCWIRFVSKWKQRVGRMNGSR